MKYESPLELHEALLDVAEQTKDHVQTHIAVSDSELPTLLDISPTPK